MLPTMDTILDGAVSESSSTVSEARRKGAQSFIGLCRLTKILGELLSTIYCLRNEPLEHVLRNLRRIETSIDDWQESLPPWLNPEHGNFERYQPGSLNLRLSFLAVKMCICRVALQVCFTYYLPERRVHGCVAKWETDREQTSRVNDHDEALYHQGRCIKAGYALINFVTSLSTDETRMFWLPCMSITPRDSVLFWWVWQIYLTILQTQLTTLLLQSLSCFAVPWRPILRAWE